MAKKRKTRDVLANHSSKKQEADGIASTKVDPQHQASSPLSNTDAACAEDIVASNDHTKMTLPFKNATYEVKKSSKKKIWKGLKQILTQERLMPWQLDAVLYNNVEAPPSFKPAKKYSDLSGLPAPYTDPQSQLRFALAGEYQTIQTLPSDIVAGYLSLRKAINPVG